MDKALLDFEVSIDADCKLLTVGKPFAIEGKQADSHRMTYLCFKLERGQCFDSDPLAAFLKTSVKLKVRTFL